MRNIRNFGIGAVAGLVLGACNANYTSPSISQKHHCEDLTPTTCAEKFPPPEPQYAHSTSSQESTNSASQRKPLDRIGEIDIKAEYDSGRIPFGRAISAAAKQTGLDESLALALVYTESNNDHDAWSRADACGLAQITEVAWNEVDDSNFEENCRDPKQNLLNGFTYFKKQLDRFGNNVEHAAIAYNAGPSRVGKFLPAETRRYVEKLKANAEGFERISHVNEFSTMPSIIAEEIEYAARKNAGTYTSSIPHTK